MIRRGDGYPKTVAVLRNVRQNVVFQIADDNRSVRHDKFARASGRRGRRIIDVRRRVSVVNVVSRRRIGFRIDAFGKKRSDSDIQSSRDALLQASAVFDRGERDGVTLLLPTLETSIPDAKRRAHAQSSAVRQSFRAVATVSRDRHLRRERRSQRHLISLHAKREAFRRFELSCKSCRASSRFCVFTP